MEDTLHIEREDRAGYVRLLISGRFYARAYVQLSTAMRAVLNQPAAENGSYLVVDLCRVELISSSCIDAICSQRDYLVGGWKLSVIAPRDDQRELFEITGLDNLFPVYGTIDEFITDRIGPSHE